MYTFMISKQCISNIVTEVCQALVDDNEDNKEFFLQFRSGHHAFHFSYDNRYL
nr:unnamed protein product [Callosobruchus chinensis]